MPIERAKREGRKGIYREWVEKTFPNITPLRAGVQEWQWEIS